MLQRQIWILAATVFAFFALTARAEYLPRAERVSDDVYQVIQHTQQQCMFKVDFSVACFLPVVGFIAANHPPRGRGIVGSHPQIKNQNI